MNARALAVALVVLTLQTVAPAQTASLRIGGAVAHLLTLTAADVASMPRDSVTVQLRGQSVRYTGVPLIELLKRAGVPSGDSLRGAELTKVVVVSGADGYRVAFALAELDPAFAERPVLVADRMNDAVLPENSSPYQIIVPDDKRPSRWIRQVVAVDVSASPTVR